MAIISMVSTGPCQMLQDVDDDDGDGDDGDGDDKQGFNKSSPEAAVPQRPDDQETG